MNLKFSYCLAFLALTLSSFSVAHHDGQELSPVLVETQVVHNDPSSSSAEQTTVSEGQSLYNLASDRSKCFSKIIKKVRVLANSLDGRVLVGDIENRLGYAVGSAEFLVTLNTQGSHYNPQSITLTLNPNRHRVTG